MPTTTRFELILDHDKVTFHLRTADGQVLLTGLGAKSKIMVQNEILHVRKALRDPSHLVPHEGRDGSHWIVVKDLDGSVLAKTPHVETAAAANDLIARILALAPAAPIVDLTKHHAHAH
jgi:hypothetical protein